MHIVGSSCRLPCQHGRSAPPYQQLAVDHKDFNQQCPVANGTRRCRNMRSCDYVSHQKANPSGSKEVEYLIHNLTGRAGEVKAGTRKQMTRRLHELSECSKHQDAAVMEDSVRKTLEQLERADKFIAMASGLSDVGSLETHAAPIVHRPETPIFAISGLPTPPASARTSLESAEAAPRPSTAEQTHTFWGVPAHSTPPPPPQSSGIKPEPPQTPPNIHHQPISHPCSPPPAPAPRRRTTGPFIRTLLDPIPAVPTQIPATTTPCLTRIQQLEAENVQLREELAQANRRAETERDIAKAARRAASKWKAHYERYKGEV